MKRINITFAASILLALVAPARAQIVQPEPLWTADSGPAVCTAIPIGGNNGCTEFLISHSDGTIGKYSPTGKLITTFRMDLPTDSPPTVVNMDGNLCVISADCQGSIYRFSLDGVRVWKRTFTGKYRDFRVPVTASLYGSEPAARQAILSDSRGTVRAFDATGAMRLEVNASHYRVSSPAVGEVKPGLVGIIFGTETGDVDCIDPAGNLLWSTHIGGGFGRSLPLLINGVKPMVLIPRGFVDREPALCALNAATGKLLWKAPCASQGYHNLAYASLKSGEEPSILFGDKHTRLYCLDKAGHLRWKTQLEGKGIFFTPGIVDLNGTGEATIFSEVRGEGSTGGSLYVLSSGGALLQSLPLPGGGASAPVLVRFKGEAEVKLLTITGGKISCFKIKQAPSARIVWSGLRNDPSSPGSTGSAGPRYVQIRVPAAQPSPAVANDSGILRDAGGKHINCPIAHPVRASFSLETDLLNHAIVVPAPTEKTLTLPIQRMQLWLNSKGEQRGCVVFADADGNIARIPFMVNTKGAIQRAHERVMHVERLISATTEGASGPGKDLLDLLGRRLAADLKSAGNSADALRLRSVEQSASCLEQIAAMQELKLQAVPSLRIRQLSNPWANQSEHELLRDSAHTAPGVAATLPGNAFGSEAIAVTNLSTNPTKVTARVLQDTATPAGAVMVRECVTIVPTATGIPTQDPLPVLDAGRSITLQPGETGKLWLTLCSRGMAAGDHTVNIALGDTAVSAPPVTCPVTIKVLPITLPAKQTYRHVNWLYLASIADPAVREKTTVDALEHGTNVFNTPPCSVQVDELGLIKSWDSTAHDAMIMRLKGRAEFLIDGTVGVTFPAGAAISKQIQDLAFVNAIHWYSAHMKDLGCDYADYALYIMDEPALSGADKAYADFVSTIHRVKAADPKMRIFCNPAGGAHADVLAPIATEVDIWCPDMHLVKTQPEELSKLFKSHGEYWHYEAPADQRSLDPLGFYRMQAWTSFRYGMTGGGYWVYSSASDWLQDPQRSGEYGAVYMTPDGPVDTRRFEGTREGIQDFELLWMLKTRGESVGGKSGAAALKLVADAVNSVTEGQDTATDITRQAAPFAPDYRQWMQWRQKIVDALLILK